MPKNPTSSLSQHETVTTDVSGKSPYSGADRHLSHQDYVTNSLIQHLKQKCTEMAKLADREVENAAFVETKLVASKKTQQDLVKVNK